MTVEALYNEEKALVNKAYAKYAYQNYINKGNTIGMTSEQVSTLVNKWTEEVLSSQADTTEYELTDGEVDAANERGKQEVVDANDGEEVETDDDTAQSIGYNVAACGSTAMAIISLCTKVAGTAKWMVGVSAVLEAAVVAMYEILKPNKEEDELLQTMNEQLQNEDTKKLTDAITTAQTEGAAAGADATLALDNMNLASEDYETIQDAYEEDTEELEELIEERKALMKKAEAGPLTEKKQSRLEALNLAIADLSSGIGDMSDTLGDVGEVLNEWQEEVKEENDERQAAFDESAEATEEVKGKTDYLESFDKTVRKNAIAMGAAMALNAAASVITAVRAFIKGLAPIVGTIFKVFGAMALAAAGYSVKDSVEQFQIAKHVGDEMDTREGVQTLEGDADGAIDAGLQDYANSQELIDEATVEAAAEQAGASEIVENGLETPDGAYEDGNVEGAGDGDDGNGDDGDGDKDDDDEIFT